MNEVAKSNKQTYWIGCGKEPLKYKKKISQLYINIIFIEIEKILKYLYKMKIREND